MRDGPRLTRVLAVNGGVIRGSVVSLSLIFPHPPEDEEKKKKKRKKKVFYGVIIIM